MYKGKRCNYLLASVKISITLSRFIHIRLISSQSPLGVRETASIVFWIFSFPSHSEHHSGFLDLTLTLEKCCRHCDAHISLLLLPSTYRWLFKASLTQNLQEADKVASLGAYS